MNPSANSELDSLTTLNIGDTIEVISDFHDYDGKLWARGSVFSKFRECNCVPYHGGYTFYFENATLRLCDLVPDNCDVLFKSAKYFRRVP